MKPHFIWKDQSSLEFGIIIEKLPARIKPELKGESIDVPGRSGTLFESEDAYKSKRIEMECTLVPPGSMSQSDIDEMLMQLPLWLDGFGKLILSDYPEYYYEASIRSTIPIERFFKRYRKFPLTFEVQPFSKSNQEYMIEKTITQEEPIYIKSHFPVSPILEITGSGNITLNVNNQMIHIKELADVITIDCEFMNATTNNGTVNANGKVNGLPLKLEAGTNIISVLLDNESTFESLKIKYRSWWI